jgi:hypothetical protein
LGPETVHNDFVRIKYHKDQANDKDYNHEGPGFTFRWQADQVSKYIDNHKVAAFEGDRNAAKERVRKYSDGKGETPKKNM